MPRVRLFKKTKEQIKDEKIMAKQMKQYVAEYSNCRDLLMKIEEHFLRIEPVQKTMTNSFYKETLSDQDFRALLTDFHYPLTDLEKFIVFEWMEKDYQGKAAYSNMRKNIADKVNEIAAEHYEKQNLNTSLIVAIADKKWVMIIFRLIGFNAFKMRSHSFKKLVQLSSSGAYLRNIILTEIPNLPTTYVNIYTDSRNRKSSMIQPNDTLESIGLTGGTLQQPEELGLLYDFDPPKVKHDPIIKNVDFIQGNLLRLKTFRRIAKHETRTVALSEYESLEYIRKIRSKESLDV